MGNTTSRYDVILAVAVFALLGLGTYLILSGPFSSPGVGGASVEPVPLETMKKACIHQGVVTQTREFLVETAFRDDGIQVYLYDLKAQPLSLKGASGSARVEFPGTEREEATLSMTLEGDALSASGDLGKVHDTGAVAKLDLAALPGKEETELKLLVQLPKAADMEKARPREKEPKPEEKKVPPESP